MVSLSLSLSVSVLLCPLASPADPGVATPFAQQLDPAPNYYPPEGARKICAPPSDISSIRDSMYFFTVAGERLLAIQQSSNTMMSSGNDIKKHITHPVYVSSGDQSLNHNGEWGES